MGKKYLFIKQILDKPSLTIEEVKEKCYIDDDNILIKRLIELLALNIRDITNYNLMTTKKEITKILNLLVKLAYNQLNCESILNNLIIIYKNPDSRCKIVSDLINSYINKLLLLDEKYYSFTNLVTKEDNSFLSQNVFIIDNDATKMCEQAYYIEKVEDKYHFYIHIIDLTYYNKLERKKALNDNFYDKVFTFKFVIDNQGLITTQSISKNIIKIPKKIYYYNYIEELKEDNNILYQNLEELLKSYFHKEVKPVTITNLGSALIHNLMGKIAYFSNENFLYFNKKEQKHTFTKPFFDESFVKISAPLRHSKDYYNEKVLNKWLIEESIKASYLKKLTKDNKYIV